MSAGTLQIWTAVVRQETTGVEPRAVYLPVPCEIFSQEAGFCICSDWPLPWKLTGLAHGVRRGCGQQ